MTFARAELLPVSTRPAAGSVVARTEACAASGFDVSIFGDAAGFVLRAGGLEIHCDDAATAWALFEMAKSPGSRIRVERCGNRPVSFTLEVLRTDGGYRSVASSGSGGMLARFRTRTVTYLQN